MTPERFTRSVRLEVPAQRAFAWHCAPGAFERLAPPWMGVERLSGPDGILEGAEVELRVRQGPFRCRWVARHRDVRPPLQFVDEQVRGPFSCWVHAHRFEPDGTSACLLSDEVEFRPPLGLGAGWVRAELERLFRYRHAVTRLDLRAHAAAPARPLRVLVTGSRGLLGAHLLPYLSAGGHHPVRLLHRPVPSLPDALTLDSADPAAWEGLDAVVHLAGANLAARRWTPARKRELASSRVEFTRRLAERLAALANPPPVLVCASATGIYGDLPRGEKVTEDAPPGEGFLAALARDWEAAAGPAARAGIRVVHLRFGMVLSPRGGALGKMLPAFRTGLGGPLGDGTQWVSWIALDDALDAILHALGRRALAGPVNAVAPFPVSNASFASSLARALGRPAALRAPAAALRLAFGEMADALLLRGAQATPARLLAEGFSFRYPVLDAALRHLLGRYPPLATE
jgi:uncharacterized protein (TIGR01777 family)